MLDFSEIKINNREPMYLQIVQYVKRQIYIGNAANGDVLPSRRELAARLGINPNTVQKAFKLMEEQGLIETPANAASSIQVSDAVKDSIRRECTVGLMMKFIGELKEVHIAKGEAMQMLRELWEEEL